MVLIHNYNHLVEGGESNAVKKILYLNCYGSLNQD